ncbi:hypothetical protein [Calothrix sp. UHCC 0171]|uniref:hypothetical protein n=1 Tax=Calothrix sp. UHCC 0171 TaxID=3110245 RepID=UPI002B213A4F|nr:hypothetical protein [Calothrix sp. UHCC 0171]MEA5570128.1 hypothetical protein [Calothrix sp. UHCC 0171]
MSLSALRKFVLPPVIVSAAVFSVTSCPLAVLGDKPINIRFEEEPVFDGRLRDIAPPYVVAITALSLGAGIATAAICGWRNSSRKSLVFEQQLTALEEHLEDKDKLIKELKLSESRIQLAGLNNFLDEEIPFDDDKNHQASPAAVTQPVVAQTQVQKYQLSPNTLPPAAKPTVDKPIVSQPTVANAASAFTSGQTYMARHTQPPTGNKATAQSNITAQEFEMLQIQLREMMARMQMMQNSLKQPETVGSIAMTDRFQVYYDTPNTEEVQF